MIEIHWNSCASRSNTTLAHYARTLRSHTTLAHYARTLRSHTTLEHYARTLRPNTTYACFEVSSAPVCVIVFPRTSSSSFAAPNLDRLQAHVSHEMNVHRLPRNRFSADDYVVRLFHDISLQTDNEIQRSEYLYTHILSSHSRITSTNEQKELQVYGIWNAYLCSSARFS